MALVPTGSKTRSGGIFASIKKHLNYVNLKPAKKVTVKFDPFGQNSMQMRRFLIAINNKKVLQTNPYCKVLTEVLCDRSEPTVNIILNSGDSVTLKCNNLTVLDMIKICNEHVSSLVPKEEAPSEQEVRRR